MKRRETDPASNQFLKCSPPSGTHRDSQSWIEKKQKERKEEEGKKKKEEKKKPQELLKNTNNNHTKTIYGVCFKK